MSKIEKKRKIIRTQNCVSMNLFFKKWMGNFSSSDTIIPHLGGAPAAKYLTTTPWFYNSIPQKFASHKHLLYRTSKSSTIHSASSWMANYLTQQKIMLYFDQTGTNLTDHAISLCNANTSHVMLLTILYDLFIKLSFLCSVIKCVCQTSTSSSLHSYLQSLLLRE